MDYLCEGKNLGLVIPLAEKFVFSAFERGLKIENFDAWESFFLFLRVQLKFISGF